MKRIFFLCGWLAIALVFSTSSASAQASAQLTAVDTNKLAQAVSLFNQGRFQAADTLLAYIHKYDRKDKADPDYAIALCYEALCLYDLTNRLGYLKAVESPVIQQADLPSALREDLDYKQINVMFFYRQFDQLLPRIARFEADYPDSAHLPAVAEYQMATWYERGMKKIYEACASDDPKVFQKRYPDGQSNLVDFLHLAAALNKTNYQVLPKRVLPDEILKAQIALGGEKQARQEALGAGREDAAFHSLELHCKLQPRAMDDNLARMTNFLNDYPGSRYRKRVRFDIADISFPKVEALYRAAGDAGNTNAAGDRLEAQAYLQLTESLTNEFYVDQAAGISASDVLARQDDLFNGYYLENNYARILAMTAALITNSTPGSLTWLMAKTYRGIVFQSETPPDLKQSAAELEAVIAFGFNRSAEHNHWVLTATSWRIGTARKSGDQARAVQLVKWVQGADGTKNQQARFLKAWSFLLNPGAAGN